MKISDEMLPALPSTDYNACGDGSGPLYTAKQMRDYARAALEAAMGVGPDDGDSYQRGYGDGYDEGYQQRATDSSEPVAWRGFCSDGVEFETDRAHCESNPGYWQALYAYPPARYTIETETGPLLCSLAVATEWEKSEERITELQAALAAREPVGCGACGDGCAERAGCRVAEESPAVGPEPVAVVSGETFSDDGTSDIIKPNLPVGTKLYAAPPTQPAVYACPACGAGMQVDPTAKPSPTQPHEPKADLGQFRFAVECYWQRCSQALANKIVGPLHLRAQAERDLEEAARLLALIDGKEKPHA